MTAVRVYCDSASATESYTVYYTLNYTDSSSSATQSWTTTTTDWSSAQSFSVSTNNVASVTIWLDEDVTADYFEAWGGSDWNDTSNQVISSETANKVTLTFSSAVNGILQVGVSGIVSSSSSGTGSMDADDDTLVITEVTTGSYIIAVPNASLTTATDITISASVTWVARLSTAAKQLS
ncbi:MAG: hypothetical protein LIO74_06240 [Ruminococcus sp.]|nr:hypothetical protein [Ruminococcus sp.]